MITTFLAEQNGWRNLSASSLEPYASSGTGYLPVWGLPSWEENFDGPLDSAVWNIRNGYQESQDISTMLPANVIVENSSVKLRAKKETYNGRDYTSGYIDTNGKWGRRYGRFEFRAKLPLTPGISRGMWPGIWLRDATGGGECDIMEAVGSPNDHPSTYPASPGRYSSSLYRQTGVRNDGNYWSKVFQNIDAADGNFHTFAVEWTPNGFTFITDGIVQHVVSKADYDTLFEPGFPSTVNIRIDLFVGSSWMGWPNDTDTILPLDLEIDYIRYWSMP